MNTVEDIFYNDPQPYSHLGQGQPIIKTLAITLDYIISDIKKKPRSFKIGLFTIYLVVTFLALIQSAFALSPLIFLQLAETTSGDTDLIFSPLPSENRTIVTSNFGPQNRSQLDSAADMFSTFSLINSTLIDESLDEIGDIYGQSPRWLMIGNLDNFNEGVLKISEKVRSFVLIIDSVKEMSIGLGRRLDSEFLVNNEIMVSKSGLRGLNASVGDTLSLNVDIVSLLNTYMPINSNSSSDSDSQGKQFFDALFDQYINQALIQAFGPDVLDQEYQVSELKILADELVVEADIIESDPQLKASTKQTFENQIRALNLSQSQEDLMINAVETIFAGNTSSETRVFQTFVDRLDQNGTITIRQIEGAFSELISQAFDFEVQLVVKQSVESPRGKWADGLGNIVVIDYSNATKLFVNAFLDRLTVVVEDAKANDTTTVGAVATLIEMDEVKTIVHNNTDDIDLQEYSLSSNFVFDNRVSIYTTTDSVRHAIISRTNNFFTMMGYDYPVTATITLATTIQQFFLLKNFIDNLIVSATFLLLMLSVLLIYSLMIGDVEEKTYEFGMLRALGFKKKWLIVLLTFQALTFALPGLFLGLLTCYILNSIVAMFIFDSSYLVSTFDVAPSAIGLAFGLGFFIPLASNILPIMRALSKTLRDSLDLYHRTVNDILVTVVKLEKLGVAIDQTFSAILLILMGFVSYYLIPMAFIFNNIQLALAIINIILIIMIVGFTLLINLVESPFEKLILNIMLCFRPSDKNLKPIILKNMEGHYSRNWKTTLMYTIALAFLIFAGAGFALQTEVIADLLQSTLGSDITVNVMESDQFGLDEYKIRQFMEDTKNKDPSLIDEYSFSSYLLNRFPDVYSTYISTLARFPWKKIRIGGVEKNYLRSLMQQYYIPNEYDDSISYATLQDGQKDGVDGLYNREGNLDLESSQDYAQVISNTRIRSSFYDDLNYTRPGSSTQIDREINVIMPEGYKYEAAIEVNTPSLFFIGGHIFRMKIRHMATKVPGFFFSEYRSITSYGNGLISLEDQLFILNDYYHSDIMKGIIVDPIVKAYFLQLPANLTYGMPKDALQIKFARTTSLQERIDFSNGLRNYFRNEQTLLFDVIQMRIDAEDTFFFITLFYIIVAIVAMTLSFFLILVSFVSNVKDNSWEFGVLRAVGLNKQQITRVYIYEAVSLITASGLLGTIIGLVVAITLTLQILMFTELPFKFVFPTEIFLITFVGGFLTAVFGSYFAVLELRDKSISTILKGLL